MGLGDVIIFLCFGPLLMSGVSMACCGVIHESVQYYSVPIGLLTVDIVHINNMRDVDADKRAGLKTVAIFLGKRCRFPKLKPKGGGFPLAKSSKIRRMDGAISFAKSLKIANGMPSGPGAES